MMCRMASEFHTGHGTDSRSDAWTTHLEASFACDFSAIDGRVPEYNPDTWTDGPLFVTILTAGDLSPTASLTHNGADNSRDLYSISAT